MQVNEIVTLLDSIDDVLESYVLTTEIKMYLDLEHDYFHPVVKVKIYKSSILGGTPYQFVVSHHAHTPTQAAPYYPSRTSFSSEEEAIREAISTTTNYLKGAIAEGHEPEDKWLVINDSF